MLQKHHNSGLLRDLACYSLTVPRLGPRQCFRSEDGAWRIAEVFLRHALLYIRVGAM